MTYAIIGSGAIGSAIAKHFAHSNIDVLVANSRGPASLVKLVNELGTYVKAATIDEALKADMVFLAVPFTAVTDAVAKAGPWKNRIVIDATNAINFSNFTPADLGGRLSSHIVAESVPGARVVKAFNTLPAAILAGDPNNNGGHRVLFVSGDHANANAEVATLAERLGFVAVDLGRIDAGGRLQQFGGPLMVHNLVKYG